MTITLIGFAVALALLAYAATMTLYTEIVASLAPRSKSKWVRHWTYRWGIDALAVVVSFATGCGGYYMLQAIFK